MKLVLLAIALFFQQNEWQAFVTTQEVQEYYKYICKKQNEKPRQQTQFWAYLQDLSREGVVELKVVNRHSDTGEALGRTTQIKMSLPVEEVLKLLKCEFLSESHHSSHTS